MNRHTAIAAAAALALYGCGGEDVDAEAVADALEFHLDGDDLGMYVTEVTSNGSRVRVHTQLHEDQTSEADALCNVTTVATYGLDDIEVSGVDVAAAGGRNIAHCRPRV